MPQSRFAFGTLKLNPAPLSAARAALSPRTLTARPPAPTTFYTRNEPI
jgi:hypothetical protein